jgi:asparagine synthase (glutamine-hydrolysing)
MCGIAGIWGEPGDVSVTQMMDRQLHRGPDGEGVYARRGVGVLGHVRLAIMDPEYGTQPIYNEDHSRVIVTNGEIYNHGALREGLRERHRFRSGSDGETALHVFEEMGCNMVEVLDGPFALALADRDQLLLARDRIGIKPLYYGHAPGNGNRPALVFASELKAMPPGVRDVFEFPPGTYYHSQQGFQRYYTVPECHPAGGVPPGEHGRRVREVLERAVEKRLMSDVPLGSFLSGGLDSSIIAAIARQHMDRLHTFSVGIEGARDLDAARRVAAHIGSVHHAYTYTVDEVLRALPEIIYHLESFDQDLVRSAIPTYFCARLAAHHVKVILTGEGADELFAGYTYHKDIGSPAALHRELHQSVTRLHNINLQRVDRLTMRHCVEGRVPFLDVELIELAQEIPPELKLRADGSGRRVEKWILRKACEDLLPPEIVWRDKEQFDEGSGTVDLVPQIDERARSVLDAEAYMAEHARDRLRSAEECLYHKILTETFPRPELVLANVGRWQAT